jgi:glycosyltransferase involved in cell wall biosynthesis
MSKKILHIFTVSATPFIFMKEYFKMFNEAGFKSKIVVGKDNFLKRLKKDKYFESININVAPYSRSVNAKNIIQSIFFTIRLFFNSIDDVIVLHTPIASFYGAIARFFTKKITVVFYCHGLVSYQVKGLKGLIIKSLEKFIFKMMDKVIFVSPSLEKFSIKHQYVKNSKVLSYTGSISGVLANKIIKSQRSMPPIRIGYLGRLSPSKGIFDCIKVADRLDELNVNYEFIFAGDIEVNKLFECNILKNSKFKYIGFIDDKKKFFKAIDILFFPSKREGFGMAALEANSYSIPVIGYNIIGLKDAIINGKTGFLVNPVGNVKKIVRQILVYINNPLLYQRHSLAAKKMALKRYERTKIIKEQINLFKKIDNSY